ncbi:MATE family efflux transporter [Bifidobacterium aquikefiri]|uniref:MATE family efflux transporter n=1 Tax=Bifidobacterium aquikefiri TaxID=1653207 RepID=UPI0039E90BA3
MAVTHHDEDMAAGHQQSPYLHIAALAIPTFGQLIAEPAFILIDTAVVGHVGGAALAGLSIGSTIILTTVGLCVFLAYGTTSQVARLIGAGRKRQGLEAGVDGMWLALIIGVIVSLGIFLFSRQICAFMGAQGQVLRQATIYVNAVVFGLPGMLLVYAANGIFRGLQKVRITLIAAITGAIINTVLDIVFVVILHWGILGSGIATLIAQWVMSIMLIVPAAMWVVKEGASWLPRITGIASSASDGLPLFIRTLALRVSLFVTVVAAAKMGQQVLAAYQGVNATWNLALNVLDAIGISGQSLVATALGAKHRKETRFMVHASGTAGMWMGVFTGGMMALLGFTATGLFSPDAQIQHLIMVGMVVQAVFLPLCGWMWALDGILIGAEDYRYLAATCTLTSVVYVLALWGLTSLDWPNATWRIAMLWAAINVFFIGIRAISNGIRARGEVWIERAITPHATR